MEGKIINNFKITKKIDEGGMGTVYKAKHLRLSHERAIKILHLDLSKHKEILERFNTEAKTLDELKHPNIVKIHDTGEFENRPYIMMDFLDGYNLSDYIKNITGPIPEENAIKYFIQMLDAISFAHSKNVIHRDIKPSNFFIVNKTKVITLDFGVAKILSDDPNSLKTRTGQIIGSLQFMSPEQIKGRDINTATDIYSLGVTLFNMITGRLPYDDKSMTEWDIQNEIVRKPLPKAKKYYPYLSDEIQIIIDKATQKNPSERYKSCKEFKDAILKIQKKDSSVQSQLTQMIKDFAADGIITKGEKLALKTFAEKHSLDYNNDILFPLNNELEKHKNKTSKKKSVTSTKNKKTNKIVSTKATVVYKENKSNIEIYTPDKEKNTIKKKKGKLFIFLGIAVSIILLFFLYDNYRNKKYNENCEKAEQFYKLTSYDSAKVYYNKAITYKQTDSIEDKIKMLDALIPAVNDFFNADYYDAYNELQFAADLGSGDACYYLGELLYNGLGTATDYDKAWKYTQEAVDKGFKMAYWRYALAYERGKGVEEDKNKADKYYLEAIETMKKLAENNNPEALANLGSMYESGSGVSENENMAFNYYLKAAETGYAFVMSNLASMYLYGSGTDKNTDEAIKWLKKSSDLGHPAAMLKLGKLYLTGDYVRKNKDKGIELIKNAAELNYSPALYKLGNLYLWGSYVNENYSKAFEYFKKAYEYDKYNTYYLKKLAYMYKNGYGTDKDFSKAAEYYLKAAEVDPAETYNYIYIAHLYLEGGYGISKNEDTYISYMEKAENAGNDNAREELGTFFNRKGVESYNSYNYSEALNYFKKAADKGDEHAQGNIDFMNNNGYY